MFPKTQHYVPQFVLKNFCVNENEQIYVFDKKTEKVFSTHIKNIAAENGFYNLKMGGATYSAEQNLGNLETVAANLIDKINKEETLANISSDEKLILSIFIAAQIARVKQARVRMKEMNDDIVKVLEKLGVDPNNVDGFAPLSEEEIKETTILTLKESINNFAPYILSKAWILFKAPDSIEYYISDNPVTFQNQNDLTPYGNLGLAIKGIEIYFPLSRKLSLGIFARDIEETIRDSYRKYRRLKFFGLLKLTGLPEEATNAVKGLMKGIETGEAIQSKKENVINKNSLQVMCSTRFVYSSNYDFSLALEMIRDHPN